MNEFTFMHVMYLLINTAQHCFKWKLFEVAFNPVTVWEEAHLEHNAGHVTLNTEHSCRGQYVVYKGRSLFYCSEYKQKEEASTGT
jgi:hypothetical protein